MSEKQRRTGAKYQRLVDDILRRIAEGYYRPGDKLTSENKLVEEYGYSRQTVRQALGVLENEGLLTRKRGSGTYISGQMPGLERSYNVGVIATYLSDYIFPAIISGIEEVLAPAGYQMNLSLTRNKVEDESRVLAALAQRKIDGLIVEATKSAFPNPNLDLYRRLREMQIPVVFFNTHYAELEDFVYVVTDDRQAGYELTAYMISRGCNKIGGIFKSDDMQGHQRYSGYSSALINGDRSFDDDNVLWYTTSDESRIQDSEYDKLLLRALAGCDGVICYNDKVAADVLAVFGRAGVDVPGQVMIGSFDNSQISEYASVRLTGMNHPKELLGRVAAQKLLDLMEGRGTRSSVRLPMELVVKDSTK